MASEVKWIKIVTDIFDDEKILLIETLPDSDSIIVIWFKLLCLAGKQNNSGVFVFNGLPYTEKMLATIFRRKEATVSVALKTFEQFGMIEIINDTITIPNWGKHQTLDKIDARNEYMRGYMKEYREKQKALADGENKDSKLSEVNDNFNSKLNSKSNSKVNVSSLEEEREGDIEEERDNTLSSSDDRNSPFSYQPIIDSFNSICVSLPKVTKLTDKRRKSIKTISGLLKETTFDEFFRKVEASDFLTGRSGTWNGCGFDWIMKQANAVKILEGNYDNKGGFKNESISAGNQQSAVTGKYGTYL